MTTYYTTEAGGRGRGQLHVDRNCRYIKDHDDAELVSGPRERFPDHQEVCSNCGG